MRLDYFKNTNAFINVEARNDNISLITELNLKQQSLQKSIHIYIKLVKYVNILGEQILHTVGCNTIRDN